MRHYVQTKAATSKTNEHICVTPKGEILVCLLFFYTLCTIAQKRVFLKSFFIVTEWGFLKFFILASGRNIVLLAKYSRECYIMSSEDRGYKLV